MDQVNRFIPTRDESVWAQQGRFARSVAHEIRVNVREATASARAETAENIGFQLGERLKSLELEKKDKGFKPKLNPKEALYRISEVLAPSKEMSQAMFKIEDAIAKFSSQASLKQHLLHLFHDPGVVAILIQMYFKKKKRKKILSDILDEIIEDFGDDSSIILFSALQFGKGNKEVKSKINQLYHEATQQFLGIAAFYKKLKQHIRDAKKRRKAVIAMLHSYAEDIHDCSEGLFKIKIAHVITELKRLSTVLSMDNMCEEVAEFLNHLSDKNIKKISGEQVIDILIEWLDTSWIYDAMIMEKMTSLSIVSFGSQILFLQRIRKLFKRLPRFCFDSEESQMHILETLQQEINKISKIEDTA